MLLDFAEELIEREELDSKVEPELRGSPTAQCSFLRFGDETL